MSRVAQLVRSFAQEIRPWARARGKKPLLRQLGEAIGLWRRYGAMPTQYLRAQLYLRDVAEVDGYMPYRPLRALQEAGNGPEGSRLIVDKALFARHMRAHGLPVIGELMTIHPDHVVDRDGQRRGREAIAELAGHGGPLFVKPLGGRFGQGVFVIADPAAQGALSPLEAATGALIVQPVIVQHPALARLHPASVNTVRIHSLRYPDGRVELHLPVLKVGAGGSVVDNGSAGGISVGVDMASGRLSATARQRAAHSLERLRVHPDTGAVFGEMAVPHWEAVCALARRAAAAFPDMLTIGWDVAVTADGALLIEGNRNWGTTLIQLSGAPVGASAIGRLAMRFARTGRIWEAGDLPGA